MIIEPLPKIDAVDQLPVVFLVLGLGIVVYDRWDSWSFPSSACFRLSFTSCSVLNCIPEREEIPRFTINQQIC